MSPGSLERGADRCRSIAGDIDRIGDRVASLPHPEGMPGDAASELASIVAALGRSQRAAGAQGRWLDYRARLGLLADGPFSGGAFDFGAPPLLSPWDLPETPPANKPKRSGWSKFWGDLGDVSPPNVNFAIGVAEGLYGLGKGAVETIVVGGAHLIDRRTGRPISDSIPWVGGLRRDFDAGVAWALKHPKEFAELMGKNLIAADEDNAAQRAGKITVEIAGLVVSVSKLAKLGKLARLGKVPETKAPNAPKPDTPSKPPIVPSPTSEKIAHGHAWSKHKKEFPELSGPDDLARTVERVRSEPTHHKQLSNGREAWYDSADNTLVIYDPKSPDLGTVFRPVNGVDYYGKLK